MASRRHPKSLRARARARVRARVPEVAEVSVKVDRGLKKAYDDLVVQIAKASASEASEYDRRWEAAAKIIEHNPPLYVVGGYKDQDAFFREVMHEEPRMARRHVRVAKFASPREEVEYGVTKLDAALGLIEAKLGHPLAHPPLPVAFERLRVPSDSKKTTSLSLADATVAQITAATSALRRTSGKAPAAHARVALEDALGKIASLADVVVREHAGIVSFTHVPLAALSHFARALASLARIAASPAPASPRVAKKKTLQKRATGRRHR